MDSLRNIYQGYIDCLNGRRLDDLGDFVHDTLDVNEEATPLEDYVGVIASDINAVPDFHWGMQDELVKDDIVSMRFVDTGTPQKGWFGIASTGKSFTMQDLAFYCFREGKVEAVCFSVDLAAVESQLHE